MEYLTLQDIPHRHYDPLHSRRMTSSHSTERPMVSMAAANHHMRHSPPIQPGEQSFPAKLPSFTEFLNTTRANTPPRTPSRRQGSANSSPQTQPHFDDVAWAESKRRRIDTLGDIYARPSVAMERPPMDPRRMSSATEHRPVHYDAVRVAQHEEAQPSVPVHHHRPSNSYPPPPHPSFASSAHLRHQSSPPVSQGNVIYPPQPPRHSIAAHATYPPASVPHGTAYEQRPGYYQDSQRAPSMYGYERPHDAYYHQPPYPGPGFDHPYGDNIRFQQHVGLDQSAFNRKRRGNLPKEATNVLKDWYNNHKASPYPTEDQKIELCTQTGLSLNQVSNWFINARRRAPQKEQREREANNPA